MKKNFVLKTSLIVAGLLALPMANAAGMAKADYQAGKTRIDAAYKADKTSCGALAGNVKDVCSEEAQAKQKVALAELEYAYTGKPADANKVLVVKAETAYEVAKEKCDDKAGNVKDVCVKEAKAIEVKALADAKAGKQIGEVRKDANEAKRDADYKVATEKCDAMAGDAKDACMASAKTMYSKS
jgi:hypothetical protein